MKKLLLTILILILCPASFMFVSCNEDNATTTEPNTDDTTTTEPNSGVVKDDNYYLSRIYQEQGSDYYNNRNVISTKPVITIDKNVEFAKKIKIDGVEEILLYVETEYYPINDRILYLYLVNGEEEKKIWLNQDGDIYKIWYAFDHIDISHNATPEEVLPAIKEVLNDYVDLSYYSTEELIPPETEFGSWIFVAKNTIDGYLTDRLYVLFDQEGYVIKVIIENINCNITSLDIDEEKVDKLLELKFKDIYDIHEGVEYRSYELSYMNKRIVILDKNEYIICTAGANLYFVERQEEHSTHPIDIYLPVDLITVDK
ncbi:MAG: hypothetical protein IJW19_05345 [Clostridia bacterium]|nr:hypothetical protein [Clostridia bacterium]